MTSNTSCHIAVPAGSTPVTFIQNAQRVNISGNPYFQNNVYGAGNDGLKALNGFISFDAQIQFDSSAHDPDRQCHPGTREIKKLRDWIDNPEAKERIFWLYGPAGAGKSAIAQTIAHSYARPKVAATFFFFRPDINWNDGNLLFTTLAYQIALSIPEIRDYIAHSLSETQFKHLLARPFQVLSDDATQQLAPAAHTIIDIVNKYQELAPGSMNAPTKIFSDDFSKLSVTQSRTIASHSAFSLSVGQSFI